MKFLRRRYIVDAGLQMRFTLLFVFVSLLGSIAAVAAFNFFALKKLEALRWGIHLNLKTTGEFFRPLFIYINIADFFFVSILLIITGVWMIKKVSGPLYRMSKDIMRVANGDLSVNINLRQKDEFRDIALGLNTIVKSIRDKFKVISEKYTEISKSIAGLKYEISNKETGTRNCSSILENIKSLETEINSFKLRQRK